jgi:signal transduction histidine kinase
MTIWPLLLLGAASAGLVGWLWQCNHALRRQRGQQVQASALAVKLGLDQAVQLRTTQLTELAQHLQTAREDERLRLARDLHDELGALLTSAKLDAARIRARLGTTAPESQERLAHLVSTLDSMIALKRSIVEDLHPSALNHLGLVATLEILAREFGERSGLPVHCDLDVVQLPASAELMVYRVVQEAITNISKHARARNVNIHMAACDGRVDLSVRDDGVGFDTRVPPRSAYGLVGMRYRVEAEGGTLAVVSAPQQGTLIRLSLREQPTA